MASSRRQVQSSPDGESERRSAPVRTQSYASSTAPAELRLVLQLPSQTNSPGKRLEFSLSKTVVIVGRYGDNDLIIDHPSVSRRHARLTIGPDRQSFLVEDMGSSNGTFIGESRLEPGKPVQFIAGQTKALYFGQVHAQPVFPPPPPPDLSQMQTMVGTMPPPLAAQNPPGIQARGGGAASMQGKLPGAGSLSPAGGVRPTVQPSKTWQQQLKDGWPWLAIVLAAGALIAIFLCVGALAVANNSIRP